MTININHIDCAHDNEILFITEYLCVISDHNRLLTLFLNDTKKKKKYAQKTNKQKQAGKYTPKNKNKNRPEMHPDHRFAAFPQNFMCVGNFYN